MAHTIQITEETSTAHNEFKNLRQKLDGAIKNLKSDVLKEAWDKSWIVNQFTITDSDSALVKIGEALQKHTQNIHNNHLIRIHTALEEKSQTIDTALAKFHAADKDNAERFIHEQHVTAEK